MRSVRSSPESGRRTLMLGVTGTALALAVLDALGAFDGPGMVLVGASALGAVLAAIRIRRPRPAWPWWLISAALALFIAGGIARIGLHTLGNLTSTRSLVPDVIVLPGYGLLAVGLLGFARARDVDRRRHLGVALDGSIAALSILACAWVFLIDPVLLEHQTPMSVRLALCAYPPASIFLVVVTMRIAFSPTQERAPSYWFLLLAMTAMFIGDTLYMFADVDVARVPGPLLSLPYCVAFVAAAATALHPSMRTLTEPARGQVSRFTLARSALVAIALAIPAFLTVSVRQETLQNRLVLLVIILGLTTAAVIRIVDALHTVEHSEAQLAHQASHDSLTGLGNRRLMQEHLTQTLEQAHDDAQVALLFIDLDRFKLVNDTLGHSHGDELLVQVAERLREHVRPTDLVTRIGGDEFMIVLGDVVSVSKALELANRLRARLRMPFEINGADFYVSASIGLAFATGDDPDADAEALVRDADTAMYQAKDAGRDAVAIFDQSMRLKVTERVEIENELRHAVDRGQLQLVYQPIVYMGSGPIAGMEALVRWAHPTLGVIPPSKFVPLAEDSGLIGAIDEWVLDQALGQLCAWRRQDPAMHDVYVSVNLSAVQLRDAGLIDTVDRALARNDLQGRDLCLEITESAAMRDPLGAAQILASLRGLDVRLAIDDFGTEYSSLAYLQRFPVESLKIDRSFVAHLDDDDRSDATLVEAIVAMAHALGIVTIAEGVETSQQAARLAELDCDAVQGYLYSRPVQADQIPHLVRAMHKGERRGDLGTTTPPVPITFTG
ncbi:MAG TPA: EAL domain-containing protein [Acidimicrobiales bacterium]|nr:EAL domain-containing protein [Acidimicrobiales bacterium]